MTKFFVAAGFAAVAFAATPVFGCDWSREASARDPVVATTVAPSEQVTSQAAANQAQPANVAADASARKPVDEPAPVVLVTDRH
jgi:predicted anti-sigma-YlaC factor YlaD